MTALLSLLAVLLGDSLFDQVEEACPILEEHRTETGAADDLDVSVYGCCSLGPIDRSGVMEGWKQRAPPSRACPERKRWRLWPRELWAG
jgi:hypothetical protein